MNDEQRQALNTALITREGKRFTRRQALELLGGLGIAAAALPTITRHAVAQADDHATPHASPVAGPRDDGTNLWEVEVGGMDMESNVDMHAYFPTDLTIGAGDTVWFNFTPFGMPMFHTVTFTSGEPIPPIQVLYIVEGTPTVDADGLPKLILNPEVAWPDGRAEYDGTGYINSGLDVFHVEGEQYMLTFTAPGTHDYECAIHGLLMKGSVTVLEAGAELPHDAAGVKALAGEERTALLEEGKATIAEFEAQLGTPAADGPATWDVAAGVGGESRARAMLFIPKDLTIKVGDTVRWTNHQPGEPHTITFLGGEEQPEDIIVEPDPSGRPKFVQNMDTFLPTAESTFDGNGYRNSGLYGFPPEIADLFGLLTGPYELTFTAPGEYPYYCILHAGGPDAEDAMTGTIIVEA